MHQWCSSKNIFKVPFQSKNVFFLFVDFICMSEFYEQERCEV